MNRVTINILLSVILTVGVAAIAVMAVGENLSLSFIFSIPAAIVIPFIVNRVNR